MWWSSMNLESPQYPPDRCDAHVRYHRFINGICCFIRKDAGRKAGHHLAHFRFVSHRENIIIDLHVVTLERRQQNVLKLSVQQRGSILTKKSRFRLKLRKRPPTSAAKWMTCVGWYFSKSNFVFSRSLDENISVRRQRCPADVLTGDRIHSRK